MRWKRPGAVCRCASAEVSVLALSERRSGVPLLQLIEMVLSVNVVIPQSSVFLMGWEGWVSINVGQPCD